MKLLFKHCLALNLLFVSLFFISIDSVAKTTDKSTKIKVKCHVELMGGTDIIHFGIIDSNKLSKYADWLVSKKIATGFSKQKQKVHQVKECVKSNDDFSNALSKKLDENTAR
ncbi:MULTISPECIES: TapY2 family type IVa secretion system protein [unclassified Colwellia]|jgi:hypothetical protein|uniref:TapY2 family type IVa secretion system protein n=1 Tax=unclassified Colwellia TaxID=196834 RepID=UPI0015F3A9CD|nr:MULTISPECIES: TapY2 family type IVa secretion system protein [unclassified Colwellia]MBA6253686.1 hypothetical protein [Colwellia sp. MB3u-55]MBA6396602.1 hypothetical protein [Colwellia sp. BRX10-4]